jgi:hypothetical protein
VIGENSTPVLAYLRRDVGLYPAGCSPVLLRHARALRSMDSAAVDALAPRLAGTEAPTIEQRRMFCLVDAVVREVLPIRVARWSPERAAEMRALAPIVDRESAERARAVCRKVDTDAATYAATADAYAYVAAYAAAAAADAADAAASASDAAAYADAAAMRSTAIAALVRAIEVTA